MRMLVLAGVATFLLPAAVHAQGKALAEALDRMHAGVARNVVEAAEKMPEAEYGFAPAKDVRGFGAMVGHIANSGFSYCSRARGEANPNKDDFEKVTAKAALVAGLKASVAYCEGVYKAQTDASLAEVLPGGQNPQPRGQVLVQNISHDNEHYGNLVTYMRVKGLVPPSTERAQQPRRPGAE